MTKYADTVETEDVLQKFRMERRVADYYLKYL
ncbi:MAG: hypothetical protein ACI8YN_000390 [Porticoccaceae bacterium]|jgi:hypothetical protein